MARFQPAKGRTVAISHPVLVNTVPCICDAIPTTCAWAIEIAIQQLHESSPNDLPYLAVLDQVSRVQLLSLLGRQILFAQTQNSIPFLDPVRVVVHPPKRHPLNSCEGLVQRLNGHAAHLRHVPHGGETEDGLPLRTVPFLCERGILYGANGAKPITCRQSQCSAISSQWIEQCEEVFEIGAGHLWYDDRVVVRGALCLPGTGGQGKHGFEEGRVELQHVPGNFK
jgi:hypothetical protein